MNRRIFILGVLALLGCATGAPLRPVNATPQLDTAHSNWSGPPPDAPPPPPPPAYVQHSDLAEAAADDELAAELEVEQAIAEDAAAADETEAAGIALAASTAPRKRPSSRGKRIAYSASRLVGLSTLTKVTRQVPDDCTGVPRFVFKKYGIDLMDVESRPGENGVTLIHRRARKAKALHKRVPRPGDLVFFRETYDRNRDGRRNDGLTHVGIVEKVEKDGTVVFVHRGSKGVSRARMNLRKPKARAEDGRVLNDYLRPPSASSRAYLTGELFSSFASPERL